MKTPRPFFSSALFAAACCATAALLAQDPPAPGQPGSKHLQTGPPRPAMTRDTARSKIDLETGLVFAPNYDAQGLVAAIVTDASSGAVLMFAWMNAEAVEKTLASGYGHFWSRSRKTLWKKGEESGNLLQVRDIRVDCDQDALLLSVTVEGAGAACHTGQRSCFYRSLDLGPGSKTLKPAL